MMTATSMAGTSPVAPSVPIDLLIVSPNEALRKHLSSTLRSGRWRVREARSGAEALEQTNDDSASVVLLDPMLPDLNTDDFKFLLQAQSPRAEVLPINPQTGQLVLDTLGGDTSGGHPAFLELTREFDRNAFARPATASEPLRPKNGPSCTLPGMIGSAPAMQQLSSTVQLVARRNTAVLVRGESGTGKDLVAHAIHELSPRNLKPFVVINCAAIPEPLLEAELFGYVKGAFTGAVQSRIGRIHAAQGGTLFLDEIGELPIGLQAKLLRFLEQGEIQRLGSTDTLRIDVRVVAATNADLQRLIRERLFREDLYYRLSVFPIDLPPLRDRMADLPALARAFVTMYSGREMVLSEDALHLLQQHNWPGNVRELRNVIERATIVANQHWMIQKEHILL